MAGFGGGFGQLSLPALVQRFVIDTSGISTAEQRAASSIQRVGQQVRVAGAKMSKLVTLPILGAGAAAAKLSIEFEESMQKIVGLVGLSREEVAGFKDDVLALAGETARAPRELADALFFITSSGIKANDALEVLDATAKASAAGLGETQVVADALTSAIGAYGSANISAGKAAGILVATVREGKIEATELAGSIGRVLPLASQMGVSFDQVGAALASMSLLGLDAAEATTALRGTLASFIKPTKQGVDTLKKMGLSFEDLRNRLRAGDILGVLLDIQTAFKGNEEALAAIFPNIRALTGVLNLTGKNVKNARGIFAELAKTTEKDLTVAFDAATETVGFKFKQALQTASAALIQFGDIIAPPLAAIAKGFSTILTSIGELPPGTKAAVTGVLFALAALGPGLNILGRLTTGVGGIITKFAAVGPAVAGATGSMTKFSAALGALGLSPVGLAITALVAGVTFLAIKMATAKNETEKLVDAIDALNVAQASLASAGLDVKQQKLNLKVVQQRIREVENEINLLERKSSLTQTEKNQLRSLRLEREQLALDEQRNNIALTDAIKRRGKAERDAIKRRDEAETAFWKRSFEFQNRAAQESGRIAALEAQFPAFDATLTIPTKEILDEARTLAKQAADVFGSVDMTLFASQDIIAAFPPHMQDTIRTIFADAARTGLINGLESIGGEKAQNAFAKALSGIKPAGAKAGRELNQVLRQHIDDPELRERFRAIFTFEGKLLEGVDFRKALRDVKASIGKEPPVAITYELLAAQRIAESDVRALLPQDAQLAVDVALNEGKAKLALDIFKQHLGEEQFNITLGVAVGALPPEEFAKLPQEVQAFIKPVVDSGALSVAVDVVKSTIENADAAQVKVEAEPGFLASLVQNIGSAISGSSFNVGVSVPVIEMQSTTVEGKTRLVPNVVGHVPVFHEGGVVPGPPSKEVLALLRGQERVLTPRQVKSITSPITVEANINVSGAGDPLEVARRVKESLVEDVSIELGRRADRLARTGGGFE